MIEHLTKTVPSIIAQYHKAHDIRDVPILVDHLKPMIEERGFVDRIIWEKYDFPATNIAAQVSFFEAEMGVYLGVGQYARVQYSSSLNFCWERFAVCKEMFHCIIDQDAANRIAQISDLLKLAEALVSDVMALVDDFAPHKTEGLAEILALETLFPLELRTHHRADYDAGLISDYQLALRYRIPQEFARVGMYPNYMAGMEKIRAGTLIELS